MLGTDGCSCVAIELCVYAHARSVWPQLWSSVAVHSVVVLNERTVPPLILHEVRTLTRSPYDDPAAPSAGNSTAETSSSRGALSRNSQLGRALGEVGAGVWWWTGRG